jgi:hypothetical protein
MYLRSKTRLIKVPQSKWRHRIEILSQWGSRWAGLIGIVTALIAAIGTWYQGVITREHNELSVKPELRFVPYIGSDLRKSGIYITNVGLGPAKVIALRLKVAGQQYDLMQKGSQRAALRGINANLLCFTESQPVPEFHVKVGDFEPLFISANKIPLNNCEESVAKTLMSQKFEFDIKYLSMYDREFPRYQEVVVDPDAYSSRWPTPGSR